MNDEKKWYVYLLCDPDTEEPFYVGKGTGDRIEHHERKSTVGGNPAKKQIIEQIHARGKRVLKKKLAEFDNEKDAFTYEFAIISLYGESVTNILHGGGTYPKRRKTIQDIPVNEYGDLQLLTIQDLMNIFGVGYETARKFYKRDGLEIVLLPPNRLVRFTHKAVRKFMEQRAAS